MARMIFINLPVADLDRSIAFYEAVGAIRNAQFSDTRTAMMSFSDAINVMLMTHARFGDFTDRTIADASSVAQVLLCLSADSRGDVDAVVTRAGIAGGGIDPSPIEDFDFMYGRSFEDPDGHLWGITWMDLAAAGAMIPEAATA